MKMNRELIKFYLHKLTMGRGVNGDDPMSDLGNSKGDIRTMQSAAAANGDLDWLRLSMDALIAKPRGRIQAFAGMQYPLTDDELVDLFSYAYGRIWPSEALSEPGNEVELEFVDMSDAEWALMTHKRA
jgi:hypothetical protein